MIYSNTNWYIQNQINSERFSSPSIHLVTAILVNHHHAWNADNDRKDETGLWMLDPLVDNINKTVYVSDMGKSSNRSVSTTRSDIEMMETDINENEQVAAVRTLVGRFEHEVLSQQKQYRDNLLILYLLFIISLPSECTQQQAIGALFHKERIIKEKSYLFVKEIPKQHCPSFEGTLGKDKKTRFKANLTNQTYLTDMSEQFSLPLVYQWFDTVITSLDCYT
ncbi:unnamed protein product [Rotaria sp. Silwood2]|nr:unnamed protein product [Rotaria sp. Silwood2]CAF3907679.1 unnamed protein product [Rotaria sp. Silwood2]